MSYDGRKLWTQAVSLTLIIIGLVVWFIHSQTKPLDRNELKIEVARLRSYCAEAELLDARVRSYKPTQTFFQVESYLLLDKTNGSRRGLEDADVEPGLEIDHWQARQLASRLKAGLERMSGSFDNSPVSNIRSTNFSEIFVQLKMLEDSLAQ